MPPPPPVSGKPGADPGWLRRTVSPGRRLLSPDPDQLGHLMLAQPEHDPSFAYAGTCGIWGSHYLAKPLKIINQHSADAEHNQPTISLVHEARCVRIVHR
jgi:hypothetical protein